jgi:hypothetical protein
MDDFLDYELTEYESRILIPITKNLMKQKGEVPTFEEILHELIRLAAITVKHFPSEC